MVGNRFELLVAELVDSTLYRWLLRGSTWVVELKATRFEGEGIVAAAEPGEHTIVEGPDAFWYPLDVSIHTRDPQFSDHRSSMFKMPEIFEDGVRYFQGWNELAFPVLEKWFAAGKDEAVIERELNEIYAARVQKI